MKETTAKQMTAEAIEARRAYKREWYAKNREKAKKYAATYWERRAVKERQDNGKVENAVQD